MTLGDIIRDYRSKNGLSMQDFAVLSGLSRAYISILERNSNPSTGRPPIPSLNTIKTVASSIGVDVNQLIAALDADQPVSIADDFDVFSIPGISPMPETRKIPLLGAIACGTPILAAENLDGEVDIPKSIHADFALVCRGDSMINARIFDGDVVYIRQQPTVENGEIAAVLIDDEATLKRVHHYDDRVVLSAENPMYKPLVYWQEDIHDIRILGKAIGFTSQHV